MVSRHPWLLAMLAGAALGLGLQACMRFDAAMKAYCQSPKSGPPPCTCVETRLNTDLNCCINPGFECQPGQPCCDGATCEPLADGGGVCGADVVDAGSDGGADAGADAGSDAGADAGAPLFDAGILCESPGGLVSCGTCFGGGTCDTCETSSMCADDHLCSGAHGDGDGGLCKTAECFEDTNGGWYCGWREGTSTVLTLDGGAVPYFCALPGTSVTVSGNPCCYYRGDGGQVLQCDSPEVPDCECTDAGACRALAVGTCPL